MILLSSSWATQSLNDIVCYIFFCNGLPAVLGSRLQSFRCCNNILSIVSINMPVRSLWHIIQFLIPILKLFCSWCQELCAKLVITDIFLLAVVWHISTNKIWMYTDWGKVVVLKDIFTLWCIRLQERTSRQYMKYSFVLELSFFYIPLYIAVLKHWVYCSVFYLFVLYLI